MNIIINKRLWDNFLIMFNLNFDQILQTSICIELYVRLKRTVAVQRHTQIREIENGKINIIKTESI
nr:MAG TPA: hypothetical protein [Caudoviricetes sp.]